MGSSYLSPHRLDILLHIAPKLLWLLQRREMPAARVLFVCDDVGVLVEDVLDSREEFVREE